MPGFVVLAQVEEAGEVWLKVETTARVVGCGSCGTRAVGHGRRQVVVRDLPAGGRPVVLVWAKRLWRCPERACEVVTWSETTPAITARASLTERARASICRRVGNEDDSVAALAREFGVGWHAAMAAVVDHGTPLIDDPARLEGVSALGLDETRFLAGTRRRRTQWVTGLVDVDRAHLLDVVPGRSGPAVHNWLDDRPAKWLAGIDVVTVDAFRGYVTGVSRHLPQATVVLDHFHAIRLANQAVDEVRRRVQQHTLGHRGHKDDPLYRIRRLLLVGHDRLDPTGWDRIIAGLNAGDPEGEVAAAYLAKELLREVYTARGPAHARRRLIVFFRHCANAEVPELRRLATTIDRWADPVIAYHTTGVSNGPTEAVNLIIEKVRRIGHGFRNFTNYRLRLLLRCGTTWHTQPVERIRGHKPRLTA